MPRKTPFSHKKWKTTYDDLITAILSGKTHRDAAAAVGVHEVTLSKLFRWPVFMKEYRRRRALKVEESDAWLQASTQVATVRLLEILNMNRPQVVEYTNHKGQVKRMTIKPNFHLVQSTALAIIQHSKDRTKDDQLFQKMADLERECQKVLQENS